METIFFLLSGVLAFVVIYITWDWYTLINEMYVGNREVGGGYAV